MSITIKIAATTALALAILVPTTGAQAAALHQTDLALGAGSAHAAPILVATPVPEPPRTRKFRVSRAGLRKGTSVPQPPNKRRVSRRNKFNPGGKVGFNPKPEPPRIKNLQR